MHRLLQEKLFFIKIWEIHARFLNMKDKAYELFL